MKKFILLILAFFIALFIFQTVSFAQTIYISCPEPLQANKNNIPLTASEFADLKKWDQSLNVPMMNCRGSYSFSDLIRISFDITVQKISLTDKSYEFKFDPYDKTYETKPFSNGKIYMSGTPFGGTSHPGVIIRKMVGSCEVIVGGYGVTTEAGSKLWGVREGPTASLLAEQKKAGDYLVKTFSEATQKIESDITSNVEVANFCGVRAEISSPSEKTPASTYIEALIDKVPTKDDLKFVPLPQEAEKSPLTAVVMELDGIADMQLADGTWVVVKDGDLIPSDAKIMVGFDSNLTLQFSDHMVATLRSLTEFDMHRFAIDANHLQIKIDTDVGDIRFKVLEGRFQTDLEVSTPVSTGAVSGTDVGVSYHKEKGSIWEVYDGRLEVTNKKTGEKKVITSSYNNFIKRIEISNDGTMTEKTAIPKVEWQNFLASSQKENKATSAEVLKTKGLRSFIILLIVILVIVAAIGYVIIRKRYYLKALSSKIATKVLDRKKEDKQDDK